MRDALGDRMKGYEQAFRYVLPGRLPVILRLDGRAFHTWTRGLERPFSPALVDAMNQVAIAVCKEAHGAALAYVQSDEISIFLHTYRTLETAAWFDNQVQKLVSVAASIAGAAMTAASARIFGELRMAAFDARAFVLPEAEVCNYFVWRQQDAIRNSIRMLAQAHYGEPELHGKSFVELHRMIRARGQDWEALPIHLQRGRCALKEGFTRGGAQRHRWVVDEAAPLFAEDRAYVERHLAVVDEDEAGPKE